MAEYIERKAVISYIGELFTLCHETMPNEYGHHFIVEKELQVFLDSVVNIPAADVQPVRHGRWMKSEIPGEKFVCSECGGACWYYDYKEEVARSRYCPNCGADMMEG